MDRPDRTSGAPTARRPDLRWTTHGEAALLVCRGAATIGRVVADYVIPHSVSSLGLLRAYRTVPGDRSDHRPEESP